MSKVASYTMKTKFKHFLYQPFTDFSRRCSEERQESGGREKEGKTCGKEPPVTFKPSAICCLLIPEG